MTRLCDLQQRSSALANAIMMAAEAGSTLANDPELAAHVSQLHAAFQERKALSRELVRSLGA